MQSLLIVCLHLKCYVSMYESQMRGVIIGYTTILVTNSTKKKKKMQSDVLKGTLAADAIIGSMVRPSFVSVCLENLGQYFSLVQ